MGKSFMLKRGINFLAGRQAEIRARLARAKKNQVFAFSILIIYSLSVLVVLSLYFWQKAENKKTRALIEREKRAIQERVDLEMKQIFLKDKLASLMPILEAKRQYQEAIEAVFTLVPPGLSISGFAISESGEISFSGETADFSDLEKFLAGLEKKSITPEFTVNFAKVENLRVRLEKGYNFRALLRYEKG